MTKPDKRTILLAAARLALVVAAWLQAAATREERRRREAARRIAVGGDPSGRAHQRLARPGARRGGGDLVRPRPAPPLLRERAMYYRLRHEAGEAAAGDEFGAGLRALVGMFTRLLVLAREY